MIGIADGTEAWGLTKAMARRVGVDLPAAVVEGWLTRPEVSRLVCACESCGLTPLCADWLRACRASRTCRPIAGTRTRSRRWPEAGRARLRPLELAPMRQILT